MKRSIKSLNGYSLKEIDGEIGKVEDFYFDDKTWTIRYLVVKTGNWLSGREVLISPEALQTPEWETKEFPVNLTKKQIENSPDIDTKKPVSRVEEERLYEYYPWDNYWDTESYAHGAGIFGMMPSELYDENVESAETTSVQNPEPHLRSSNEIIGYTIQARDSEIGKVTDYIVDDDDWKINFLVVETGSWLDRKPVLLSTSWIKEVNWDNQIVVVNITTDEVRNSPDFDPSEPVNEVYEHKLYDYYGRPQN